MAEGEKAPGSAPQDTQLGKKRSRKTKDTNTEFNVASKGSFPGPPPTPRSRHAFFPVEADPAPAASLSCAKYRAPSHTARIGAISA